MTTETIPVKRTPRDAESITKGALALPLQEKVELIQALQKSVDEEVSELKASAERASKIASVLAPAAAR